MPTVKLMVGGIDKQIYLPYQLAQNLGLYAKYGVKVQLSTEVNGGVGAEDAMASGQVDMAGAWYIHTIDFQSKGKAVEDVVQLSGAPGEREMCGTKSGVHSAADFKGETLGVTDLGSGTDELTQFLAAQKGITRKPVPHPRRRRGRHRDRRHPARHRPVRDDDPADGRCTGDTRSSPTRRSTSPPPRARRRRSVARGRQPACWPRPTGSTRTRTPCRGWSTPWWRRCTGSTRTRAADIANALPQQFVQNSTITKAQYIAGLTTDKGQFLPDGIMPAGGPKTVVRDGEADRHRRLQGDDREHVHQRLRDAGQQDRGHQHTTTPAGPQG